MKKNPKSRRRWQGVAKAVNTFSFSSFFFLLSLTFLVTASAYAVTIVISYNAGDVSADRVPYLKIYYKDKTTGTWTEAQNQDPHPDQNYVKADIPQFGLETVLAAFPPPPAAWRILTVSPVRSCPMAIRYDVVTSSQITIKISGGTILDAYRQAGHYGFLYDCSGFSNNMYVLQMYSNGVLVYTFIFVKAT